MVAPTNKKVLAGFAGQKAMDFYTIRSIVNIGTGDAGTLPQERLNKIIEVIAGRGQPLITNVSSGTETSPADFPSASGSTTVYTVKLALEQFGAWTGATPSLLNSLSGVGSGVDGDSVVFITSGSTVNITVVNDAGL